VSHVPVPITGMEIARRWRVRTITHLPSTTASPTCEGLPLPWSWSPVGQNPADQLASGPPRRLRLIASRTPTIITRTALAAVAALGRVPHDIKPANVFGPHRRPIKLLDFGLLSTNAAAVPYLHRLPAADRPPERARDTTTSRRSGSGASRPIRAATCFSLGALMYEACRRGIRPFRPPRTQRNRFMNVLEKDPPAIEVRGRRHSARRLVWSESARKDPGLPGSDGSDGKKALGLLRSRRCRRPS